VRLNHSGPLNPTSVVCKGIDTTSQNPLNYITNRRKNIMAH
jgi:hypothetical protein